MSRTARARNDVQFMVGQQYPGLRARHGTCLAPLGAGDATAPEGAEPELISMANSSSSLPSSRGK